MNEHFEAQFLEYIEAEMEQDLAHDLNHVLRVVKTAKVLCKEEGAQIEVVLPAAYLHDCFSFPKNHPDRANSSQIAAQKALTFLDSIHYPSEFYSQISHAIISHSFSANVTPETLEAQIVQDADRLDALGAIGIARCLQVSTSLSVRLYNPDDPFAQNRELNDKQNCVDHFFVKLFKLKDLMNTPSARIEAKIRSEFMQDYLRQLKREL
jgi:uncharacterized protein